MSKVDAVSIFFVQLISLAVKELEKVVNFQDIDKEHIGAVSTFFFFFFSSRPNYEDKDDGPNHNHP